MAKPDKHDKQHDKQHDQRDRGERRRVFSAEFKLEAVRLMRERRAMGMDLSQIGRELGIRPDMLRAWAKRVDECAGVAPRDVFPGQGQLPTEEEELRRLQRENARLAQENEFLKRAAAYFARESR